MEGAAAAEVPSRLMAVPHSMAAPHTIDDIEDHLGDTAMLIPLYLAFIALSLLLPFVVAKLVKMHAIGVGASPTYAISLIFSGFLYWCIVLVQIVSTLNGYWELDPGGLRLAWMVLTQTALTLQSFAYSKLLWMFIQYARGCGAYVFPKLHVAHWADKLVALFVGAVVLNYGAQLFVAAAFYDLGKADPEDVVGRGGKAGVALKDTGELLDLGVAALWFVITIRLLIYIRILRPRELGEATRVEMQQHNELVRTVRILFIVHLCAFSAQIVAFTPAGRPDGESIAEVLQIFWFLVQLWFQSAIMQGVLDANVRSMAAFEAAVLRTSGKKEEAASDLEAATANELFCRPASLLMFGASCLLLVVVVGGGMAIGALSYGRSEP
ncbi:hypothetical protein T492DRAFT_1144244 [Pavlovales sp. CCMP2436]|nr:hypothetical protein T492DRAFT_1144244 [Pavlovales sp. CCMP2436]